MGIDEVGIDKVGRYHPDRQPTMCYVLGGLDKKLLAPFPLYEILLTLICVY